MASLEHIPGMPFPAGQAAPDLPGRSFPRHPSGCFLPDEAEGGRPEGIKVFFQSMCIQRPLPSSEKAQGGKGGPFPKSRSYASSKRFAGRR